MNDSTAPGSLLGDLVACTFDIESGPFLRNGPTTVDEQ